MSDTYRRYGAIKQAIMQFYQPRPTGQRKRHLNTLVVLICSLIGGKHAHLSSCADYAPSKGAKQESIVERFRRWLKNDRHTINGWFLPVAKELLTTLASQPLQVVMDGSVVGRGCISLMLSVVYQGRALPRCWVVVRGAKGHFPEQTHRDLLAQLKELIPKDAQVIFLGDGEFHGTQLQADLRQYAWEYVCRTAATILVTSGGVQFQVSDLGPPRGESLAVTPAWMTAQLYGPVSILALCEVQYKEPIYLVTNLADLDLPVQLYRNARILRPSSRTRKAADFSHLSEPARLSRLLIASCLAYLWMIYLGVCAVRQDWMQLLYRQDRCDLSLFRLGLRLLARCLKDCIPIPDGFLVPAVFPTTLIRTFHKQAA